MPRLPNTNVPNWSITVDVLTLKRWEPTVRIHLTAKEMHVACSRAIKDVRARYKGVAFQQVNLKITRIGTAQSL